MGQAWVMEGHAPMIKEILKSQSSKEKCYPRTAYLPFLKDQWQANDDGLLTQFHILPEKMHRGIDDGSWFWWCDAQFIPFNDAYLFASASAFQPRPMHHWSNVPGMPNGRILLYQLKDPDHMQCHIFKHTNSTIYPKVQSHPLGQLVCYCGTGEVAVLAANGDPVYNKSRDLTNAVHVYCAIASNGISFACMKRGMGTFFLETSILSSGFIGEYSVRCHTVCPGFLPQRIRMDNVACKFSPNSSFIAVTSDYGFLFIVRKHKLEKFCIVCPDITEEALSSAEAFDYHPRYSHEILTLATVGKSIQTINLETQKILASAQVEQTIDCLLYSPDGYSLAVGFHDFNIHILDGEELSCLHIISMSSLCQEQVQRVYPYYPAVLHLSFSQNGEHLASTSCDGFLRLWRIPRLFSLQEICRDRLLASMPVVKVKKLKIPEKIKNFLLYNFF